MTRAHCGPGIELFGDGPDGGREASFRGRLKFPNPAQPWVGYGVLQAKYKATLTGTKTDVTWLRRQIKAELDAWSDPGKRRVINGRTPQYLIFATNVTLSSVPTTGGKDRINALISGYAPTLGLKDWAVWDGTSISTLLGAYPDVRRSFSALITSNEVIDAMHAQLTASLSPPRYRLDPAEPEPHGLPGELSVSQLLAARNGVVEFTGRDAELATLRRWLSTATNKRAAMLMHGPGGMGKTRLATRLAAEARGTGWRVVAARYVGDGTGTRRSGHSPDRDPDDGPLVGGLDDRARGHRSGCVPGGVVHGSSGVGRLVVVDYAERWPAEHLLGLADDPAVAGGAPVRLLLVARSAGWWTSVRHEFTERQFRTEQLRLGPLAVDVTDRGRLFDQARDRFAAVLDVSDARRIPPPGQPRRGRVRLGAGGAHGRAVRR